MERPPEVHILTGMAATPYYGAAVFYTAAGYPGVCRGFSGSGMKQDAGDGNSLDRAELSALSTVLVSTPPERIVIPIFW